MISGLVNIDMKIKGLLLDNAEIAIRVEEGTVLFDVTAQRFLKDHGFDDEPETDSKEEADERRSLMQMLAAERFQFRNSLLMSLLTAPDLEEYKPQQETTPQNGT